MTKIRLQLLCIAQHFMPYDVFYKHLLPLKRVKPTCLVVWCVHLLIAWSLTYVRLQNLPWYKTGLVSRQVLHLLSKLQNWIWPKTGQYKTCLVSNTKIEASIRATKPKPWQSHLSSETVEIFIQNEKACLVPMQSRFWCGRLSVGTKPVLVQQV